jgi:hypothetical protein
MLLLRDSYLARDSLLHLHPKTNRVSVKGLANFSPAALSIQIAGGEWRGKSQSCPIGANNASDATEERMTSYTRRPIAAAVLAVSLVTARSTYAQDATNVADQVTILPLPTDIHFARHVVGADGASAGGAGERLIYSNTLGTFAAAFGAGKLVADDITTTVPGGCKLRRYEFPVVGKVNPAGAGGSYTVDFAMYSSCPGSVPAANRPGLIIPGHQGQAIIRDECLNATDDDADGLANDGCAAVGPAETGAQCLDAIDDDGDGKVNDGCPTNGAAESDADAPRLISFVAATNVPLQTNFWFGVKFSRNNAGVVVGTPPMIGFSCDQYDYPGFPCDSDAGGFPGQPQASFNLEIFADSACADSYTGYKNNKPSGPNYNPGADLYLADDIELIASGCNMIAYEVAVRGQGFYTFKMQNNCESGPIAGTEQNYSLFGTTDVKIARFTFDPPITLPQNLSFQAKVNNTAGSVVISGKQACIGTTADRLDAVVNNVCNQLYPYDYGIGIYGAVNLTITCAGQPPVGACCDMLFNQCVGGTDDGRLCCPTNADLSPFCHSDPTHADVYPSCTPPGTCESVCREVPQMNCPWPPRVTDNQSPFFDVRPAWVKGGICDSDPFPVACGASACCRPDDVCENLTLNQCNAVPPLDAPRPWQRGLYCGVGDQTCPINACLRREGDCTFAHEGTGCSNPDCCDDVCRADPYCCTVEWDRSCAELANEFCNISEHNYCFVARAEGAALLVAADSVTDFSNARASEDTTDPGFCCSAAAPNAAGYGTVWFKFIATDTSARISTCGSDPAGDSLINVLAVGDPTTDETACATLSVIACSDDVEGCGNGRHGRICVKGLTPGRPYYVMVGSKTQQNQGPHQLEIRSPCFEQPIWNSDDCNGNGIADGCELGRRIAGDCNGNNRLDECDIADGISFDCDGNIFLDECTGLIDMFVPAPPAPSGGLGSSVAMNGPWVVVGSGIEDTDLSDRLPLHVFKQNAVGWDLEGTFDLPVSPSFVAMNSAWIVASSDRDNVAHLFHRDGVSWVPAGELQGPSVESCARYGMPVAIDDNVIALGKGFCQSGPGQEPELVYVFRYDGSQWTEEARLSAPGGTGRVSFGAALAIDGGRILVGAPAVNGNGLNAVFVYRRGPKTWEYESTLLPSDGDPNFAFGRAVALDGDVAVVGATLADDVGAAYVFRSSGTSWVQEAKLPGNAIYGRFGWSVSFARNVLVAGGVNKSSAQVFRRFEGQWVLDTELISGSFDYFGYAVHTDGSLVMIGAPGTHDPGIVNAFQLEQNDCNNNKVADGCDIRDGTSRDCNFNGIPDDCEVGSGQDCNHNGVPDACDLRDLVSFDCDRDGSPDECLGLAPFDADADGDTDLFDIAVFMRCYRGVGFPIPESICTIFDVQHNCFTDLSDFAALRSFFTGP